MGTFSEFAPGLKEAGWAVLPAHGKAPKIRGFNIMGRAPGLKAVEKWAKDDPDDDIVAVAGLCRPRPDEAGVVIVDPDDERAKDVGEDLFGYTPSRVLTRRGWHDGFRLPDDINVNELPTSLRKYGVDLDLKYGRATGIIAMPMSVHEKDNSVRYRWAPGSGAFAISEAPRLPTDKLFRFLWRNRHCVEKAKPEKKAANAVRETKAKAPTGDRCDSRHLSLNDALCSKGRYFLARDWSGFLAEAHRLNPTISACIGNTPLDAEGVMGVVLQVWKGFETGDIKIPTGDRSSHDAFRKSSDEGILLAITNCKVAGDGHLLLAVLRAEHSARCARGETFAICPFSMAGGQVIPGWTRERYENARNVLLEAGLVTCVKPYDRRLNSPAQFRLFERSSEAGARRGWQ